MKATHQFQLCEFKAATNAGPWRVRGSYFVHGGVAFVLHKGYGAKLGSPWCYVSHYASGIEIASGKRSALPSRLTRIIEAHGGAASMEKKFLAAWWDHQHARMDQPPPRPAVIEPLNAELIPSDNMISFKA